MNLYPRSFSLIICLSISSIFTTFKAQAVIPATDFKGISEVFSNDDTSPVYGISWLDSGIMSNMRFLMPEKIVVNEQGVRQYEKDESSSPLWQVVKILFPSNGGILSTLSSYSSNLGRYVKKPEIVARLMRYSVNKNENKENVIQDIIDLIGKKKAKRRFIRPTLSSLLTAIEATYAQPSCFYPTSSIQKILSAFLCHHFDNRQDLYDYTLAFKKFSLPEAKFIYEDVLYISNKPVLTLDDKLILLMQDFWINPTPYREGQALINNGTCRAFNRQIRQETGETFPDCIETSLRHFFNILFFNADKRSFSLDFLDDAYKTAHFQALKNFYEIQPPEKSNNGSVLMRSAWNQVVAGLNEEDASIRYSNKDGNDIAGGFINFIKIINTLFNLKINSDIHTTYALEESFEIICKSLQPKQKYYIKTQNAEQKESEFYGTLTFKNEKNFSFDLMMREGHGELKNLKIEGVAKIFSEKDQITEPDLKSLHKDLRKEVQDPFYLLMGSPLQDNKSLIKALDILSHFTPEYCQNKQDYISTLLENILSSIEWEDFYREERNRRNSNYVYLPTIEEIDLQSKIENVFNDLVKHKFLHDILKKNVQYVINNGMSSLKENLLFFKNCKFYKGYVPFDETPSPIQSLCLTGSDLPLLESLHLSDYTIETLNLHDMMQLDYLKLSSMDIKTLTLKNMSKLIEIDLSTPFNDDYDDDDFYDDYGPNQSHIEILELKDMPLLRILDLSGSNGLNIILENLPQLKYLNLSHTYFEEINVKKILPLLKYLNLSDANIGSIDLKNALRLRYLDLSFNSLEMIDFTNVTNLEKLNLSHTPIEILELSHMHFLYNLDLENTEKLEKLILNACLKGSITMSLNGSLLKEEDIIWIDNELIEEIGDASS